MSEKNLDRGDHPDGVAGDGHTIERLPTSVTAFVGRARRGPIDTDEVAPVTLRNFADFERIFGGLWAESQLGYAVRGFFLNGGTQAVVVRLHNEATAATLSLDTGAKPPNDQLRLVATSPGTWGNELVVQVEHPTEVPGRTDLFDLSISEGEGSAEKWLRLSVNPDDARFVARILERESALVNCVRNDRGVWLVPNCRPAKGRVKANVNSGSDGLLLTDVQFTGPGNADFRTGLYALEKVDLFNILCIPPYRNDGSVDPTVVRAALSYCEKRRAIFLLDPPRAWQTAVQAEAGIQRMGLDNRYAALYYPWLLVMEPLGMQPIEVAPSGHTAGLYARNDDSKGVWKAPAGINAELLGVVELSDSVDKEDIEKLNPLGINCLLKLAGKGCVVWGARTLSGDPECRYINVGRFINFVEQSISRGTQWSVFETNDEPLWAQVRLSVASFMASLFREGAFQGQSPEEAYFVKCGPDTMTEKDIAQGILNILVGCAVLRPSEFIILRIVKRVGKSPSQYMDEKDK